MRKILIILFLSIPICVYSQAPSPNNNSFSIFIIIALFAVIYAHQKRKRDGTSFSGNFIKFVLIGGGVIILLHLLDKGKESIERISESEIVSNIVGRNYVEFHSNSVIINIPYPKIGVSSTYGMDFPDDFNLDEVEKKIFNELRTNKYNGNIPIKACFLTIDKYGNEQKENPIVLGQLDANELKKYKNFSSYTPQISDWVTNYLRN